MGIHKLPCIEDYWSSDPKVNYSIRSKDLWKRKLYKATEIYTGFDVCINVLLDYKEITGPSAIHVKLYLCSVLDIS